MIGVLDDDPSDSAVEALNEVATAGGKPRSGSAEKFFLASSQAELTSALSDITEEVASCVFPFQSAPPDPTNIAVKVNGALVAQDPARVNGWEYTSDARLGLELFGVACDTVKAGNQSSIDIIFGCPGVEIEIF